MALPRPSVFPLTAIICLGLSPFSGAAADVFEFGADGDVIVHTVPRPSPSEAGKTLNPAHKDYLPLVATASAQYGVPMGLLLAIIQAESNWRPDVHSVDDEGKPLAYGLMQLTIGTAERFGLSGLEAMLDPQNNINTGTKYLAWLIDYFDGDYQKAVAAYNAGEGAVDKYDGIPPYDETITYVQRVADYYGEDLTTKPTRGAATLTPLDPPAMSDTAPVEADAPSHPGLLVYDGEE